MSRKGIRKFDVLKIENHTPVNIYFNMESSTFSAEFLGERFSNKDINELKSELIAHAKNRESAAWKPVIRIQTGSWQWERHTSGLEINVLFLGTINYPDGSQKTYLADVNYKDVFKDHLDINNMIVGNIKKEWAGDKRTSGYYTTGGSAIYMDNDILIDFTKERYETLKFLEQKMTEFKMRLIKVTTGDKGINFIDALTANKTIFLEDEFSKKRLLSAKTEG